MNNKVVLMDGAVGTTLWEKTDNKVPVWRYNVENPAIVSLVHKEYVEAGSKIILANTFGANGGAVGKTDYSVSQVVSAGVRLAKQATEGTDVKVALSIGPLTGLLEPYGDIEIDDAKKLFAEQIAAGMSENPDLILVQTFMDVEMLKLAVEQADKYNVPVFAAMSFEAVGRTMMGNSVQDMLDGLSGLRVDAVGLNCSLGPDLAVPIMKTFRQCTDLPLLFKPNAGKPKAENGELHSGMDIESFAEDALPALDYGVTYIGGCCGTNSLYIRRLAEKIAQKN